MWTPRLVERAAAAAPPRIIRLPRWVLAALVLTVFITAPAGAATAGGIGLRLLDAPATAGDDPRARLYIVDHLAPGTVIHRRIEVSNTTASPMHILLYPAAATIEDGSFLGAAGHTQNDLSTWTSVDPGASGVLADGRATATVTIDVPSDASPGERYGVVWAEARSTPLDGGVTLITRVGIRIYLSVGPGGSPAADFAIDSLTAERSTEGLPTILATVHNTGGRALDMSGNLKLVAGPGGLRAGPFRADLGTTLPIGGTESVVIVLDEALPAGPWDARITLRSGLIVRSAHATITFPAAGAAPSVTATPIRPRWLSPIITGLVVVLLIGIAAPLVRTRLRRAAGRRHSGRPTGAGAPESIGVGKPVGLVR